MKSVFLIAGLVLVIGWLAFRVGHFLWSRLRRPRPEAPPSCPKCGSRRLDEMSDAESGFCLACKHVWGVER